LRGRPHRWPGSPSKKCFPTTIRYCSADGDRMAASFADKRLNRGR
jgi:hypothetical protein